MTPTVRGDKLSVHTLACGRCHKPSRQAGRGYRFILGARVQVCADCKVFIDRQRAASPCAAPAPCTAPAAQPNEGVLHDC